MLMMAPKVGAALALGNCVILKPAEQTPLSALFIASLVKEVGFPKGVFQVIPGYGPTAGAALSAHLGVNKVAFTGWLQKSHDNGMKFSEMTSIDRK